MKPFGALLPFEEAIYEKADVKVSFVGHPLLDVIELPPPLYEAAGAEVIEFTADELATAHAQLQQWRAEQDSISRSWTSSHE